MALDMSKAKERLATLRGENKTTGFWKVPLGESTIRICPYGDSGTMDIEYWLHYGFGGTTAFLCLYRNFKERCPACNYVAELWKGKDNDKNFAKTLSAKQRCYAPVLVRGAVGEGIRWWSYSRSVSEQLYALIVNPEYGDITDLETGTDLIITYSKPKGRNFADTVIQPRRKASRFCDDIDPEECEKLLNNITDIKTLLTRKTLKEIEELVNLFRFKTDEEAEAGSKETEKYHIVEEMEKNDDFEKTENPKPKNTDEFVEGEFNRFGSQSDV